MRVLVAGGTGAVGKRLIPLLAGAGHQVTATTRAPHKLDQLRALGAEAVLMDGLSMPSVIKAVETSRPEAIVHEMTALASMHSVKRLDNELAITNRLRTEGTQYLLEAAQAGGVRLFVAQSYTGWPNERKGGRVKTEADPFDADLPKTMRETLNAIRVLEALVSDARGLTGVVLRYGSFYGPGTSLSRDGEIAVLVKQRKFPLVGSGAGVWSFIHVDDAAQATGLAIERGFPGIFNIADDEPAEVSVWLPELARVLGAPPPHHLPAWLARLVIGEAGVIMMTSQRGVSNEKAKRVLGWHPMYASWRTGFRRGLSDELAPEDLLKAG